VSDARRRLWRIISVILRRIYVEIGQLTDVVFPNLLGNLDISTIYRRKLTISHAKAELKLNLTNSPQEQSSIQAELHIRRS
jgi:hypothetical protein